MPHLITSQTVPFNIKTYEGQLRESHDFLVRCGQPDVRKAAGLTRAQKGDIKEATAKLKSKRRQDRLAAA
jgi:hypothetical protein